MYASVFSVFFSLCADSAAAWPVFVWQVLPVREVYGRSAVDATNAQQRQQKPPASVFADVPAAGSVQGR